MKLEDKYTTSSDADIYSISSETKITISDGDYALAETIEKLQLSIDKLTRALSLVR